MQPISSAWHGGLECPDSLPQKVGGERSHLERYARTINATEINSSFHRPHRRTAYERWARQTPDAFHFAAEVPKTVTHTAGIAITKLDRFVEESAGLGDNFPLSKIAQSV